MAEARFAAEGSRTRFRPGSFGKRFRHDDLEDPPAVDHDMEIACAIYPAVFVAGYFLHPQASPGGPDIHHGFYFEPHAIEAEFGQMPGPERVVPITQIGVPGAQRQVRHAAQHPVTKSAVPGDVVASAAVGEARSLGVIGSSHQCRDEPDDLSAVGRAVTIDRHDYVAGAGGEADQQCVALAITHLAHDLDLRVALLGHRDRVIHRLPVDQHDLVDPVRQRREDRGQVPGLILDRYNYADRWGKGQPGTD